MKNDCSRLGALLLGALAFHAALPAHACDPLPVLLYPAKKIYQQQGWKTPELPAGTIAILNGEPVLEAGFKRFMFEKVGFDPPKRELFLTNLLIKRRLEEKGVDTAFQKTRIEANFPKIEVGALYHSCDEWIKAPIREGLRTRADHYANAQRIERTYLKALYITHHWEEIHDLGLADFGIDEDLFDIAGDDEALKNEVRLNNALTIENMFSLRVEAHLRETILAHADLNLPDDLPEYKEWIHATYGTVYLLETYLGMLLSSAYAEEHQVKLAETTIREEKELRERTYRETLDAFNKTLPESAAPLEFSPVYADFIMSEIIDDLTKSRASRGGNAIQEHEISLRYFNEYGFDGTRCDIREIYRWVRKRKIRGDIPGYEAYADRENARVRAEMTALREAILSEGPESFYMRAVMENDQPKRQFVAGRVDVAKDYGAKIAETLSALKPGELSPVMNASAYTMDLFMYVGMEGTNQVHHAISKAVPPANGFDFKRYEAQRGEALELLERLKEEVENGASFEERAKEESDNYNWAKGDPSETYLRDHGFRFAERVNAIADGECGIIETEDGLHLIQVLSRERTPLTPEIKTRLSRAYYDELAPQSERYELTKKWLFEANPYFN